MLNSVWAIVILNTRNKTINFITHAQQNCVWKSGLKLTKKKINNGNIGSSSTAAAKVMA